jgi:hypothetical protein
MTFNETDIASIYHFYSKALENTPIQKSIVDFEGRVYTTFRRLIWNHENRELAKTLNRNKKRAFSQLPDECQIRIQEMLNKRYADYIAFADMQIYLSKMNACSKLATDITIKSTDVINKLADCIIEDD